jgi:hypothetical protein
VTADEAMEMINLDPGDIVNLIKRLIDIHRKWIVDGVSDAEDKENEDAGLREQEIAIEEFAAQRSLPDSARSTLSTGLRQFLNGGPTGDGDGPLVEDTPEDEYGAFADRLCTVITAGHDVREVFASFLKAEGADVKAQIARQIYIATSRLGADAKLLSIFESWSHTLDDAQVLASLQDYNRQPE